MPFAFLPKTLALKTILNPCRYMLRFVFAENGKCKILGFPKEMKEIIT
jgi:hypothetical protein